MKFKDLLSKEITKKLIAVALLLVVALLSVFVISKPATSPESYRTTIQSIDEKKATVMGITATAATASTVLAAIPGDATTPIANQIMEISSYLLIVVCVLVLEKSLLTVMGYLSFNILIPIACALLGIYIFIKKDMLKILAIKFTVFALVICTIIPLSLKISDLIYEVNKTTIEQITVQIDDSVAKKEDNNEDNNEDKSWLGKMLDKVKNTVSDTAKKAKTTAKEILNKFIDVIAMFIIAYCAIPIIVVLVVIWFIKFLFGINITIPQHNKFQLFNKNKKENKTLDTVE